MYNYGVIMSEENKKDLFGIDIELDNDSKENKKERTTKELNFDNSISVDEKNNFDKRKIQNTNEKKDNDFERNNAKEESSILILEDKKENKNIEDKKVKENINQKTQKLNNKNKEIQKEDIKNNKNKDNKNELSSGGNSFYERISIDNKKTSWTSDWRGKTLSFFVSAAVLIGLAIPSGMAATGYFASYKGESTIIGNGNPDNEDTNYSDAMNELSRLKDEAIIYHYEEMVNEGWITQTQYDDDIEEAEDNADDQIKNKKDSLQEQYGDSYEDEWDNTLQEMGFHIASENGEEEYKDSLISDSIESKVKSTYTSQNSLTQVIPVSSDNDSAIYSSETNESRGRKTIIENQSPIYYSAVENDDSDDPFVTTFTPQDLTTLYLLTYRPLIFNNTLLPFTPVAGSSNSEVDITGSNISMTNDNIASAKAFYDLISNGYTPTATNYGNIQSTYDISFESESLGLEADTAIEMALAGEYTVATTTLDTMIDTAFAASSNLGLDDYEGDYEGANDITSEEISNMNSIQVTAFETALSKDLIENGLLDDGNEATKYRNFSTIGLIDNQTVSFVSTNGLHNIGIQFEGKEIVEEQLNNINKNPNSIDVGFIESFNSWFENAFNYIIIIDYLSDPVDDSGWFTYSGFDENNYPKIGLNLEYRNVEDTNDDGELDSHYEPESKYLIDAIVSNIWINQNQKISDKYIETSEFYESNFKTWDLNKFNDEIGAQYMTYLESNPINQLILNWQWPWEELNNINKVIINLREEF
ncbi:MAG: hypothetical protein TYPL_4660 [Candidatus Tyloplasma litorale]|nr:MAG: hypothetical protein TYPL_4660 [Mycoplasmatales bacterium]